MADLSTTFDTIDQAIGANQPSSSSQPAAPDQTSAPSTPQQAMDTIDLALSGKPLPPLPPSTQPPSLLGTGIDMAQSLGTGAVEGAVGTATAPVAIESGLHGLFSKYVSEPLFNAIDAATGRKTPPPVPAGAQGSLHDIAQNTGNYLGFQPIMRDINSVVPLHQPQTVPGEYAKTLGQFGVTGGRSAILPAIGDETAGQLTKGTGLEMPARIAGALTGSGIQAGLGVGANALKTYTSAAPDIGAAQAAARQGVAMPTIALSNNPVVQGVGSSLKSLPIGGTPIRQAATKAIGQIGQAKQTAAELPTGTAVNMEDAGSSMRQGLTNYIGPVTTQKVSDLYDKVDQFVDPNVLTDLDATRGVVANIVARRQAAAMPIPSKATDLVMDAVQRPGGLTYPGIKQLRTSIGQMLDKGALLPADIPQAELKQLYGGLSDDLSSSVANAGGPQATSAFQRANTYAGLVADRRENLARILGTNRSDEGIAGTLQRLAGSKSTADADLLLQARKSVQPDEWNPLVSAMVGRLGQNNVGEFSPDRFLSDYAQVSPKAKGILFGSSGNLRQSLDDIASVSGRFKQLAAYGNTSGTTQTAAGLGELGALGSAVASGTVAAPLGVLGGFLGAHALSRFLASPPSAAAIAKWSKAYAQVATNPVPFSKAVYQRATANLLSNMNAIRAQGSDKTTPMPVQGRASGGGVDIDPGPEDDPSSAVSAVLNQPDQAGSTWGPSPVSHAPGVQITRDIMALPGQAAQQYGNAVSRRFEEGGDTAAQGAELMRKGNLLMGAPMSLAGTVNQAISPLMGGVDMAAEDMDPALGVAHAPSPSVVHGAGEFLPAAFGAMAGKGAVPLAEEAALGSDGGKLTQPPINVLDEGTKVTLAPDGMKVPDWGQGLPWGMRLYRTSAGGTGALRVSDVRLPDDMQGQGIGLQMYQKAMGIAKDEGRRFQSDSTVTNSATKIWSALKRRGYDAGYSVETAPDVIHTKGPPENPELSRYETKSGGPVFWIKDQGSEKP